MPKMNYWQMKWPLLVDVCPCDVHFNEWVAKQKLRNQTIYHFGSGTHHVVGVVQSRRGNRTFCITASKEEYEDYITLVTGNSKVAKNYVCYFGDIYLTNAKLLPVLDVVTLFHLCEFFSKNTASKAYGGITDAKVLDLLTDRTRKGGYVLFYKGSLGFDKSKPIIAKWERAKRMRRVADFKTLLVYRKT